MAGVHADRRNAPRADDSERRGRRAEPRASIVLPASVEALNGRQPLSLIEVSRAGARLEGHDMPAVGKDVILRCGKLDTFGTVVWAVNGRCGVQFDEPLDTQQLIEIRHLAVEVEKTHLTPEEIQAIADWKNGLAR
jgi:hypothetical protein